MFISRLVRGGLAESTGLLGVNDEILEVNGIDVAGKSLDQVDTVPKIDLLEDLPSKDKRTTYIKIQNIINIKK